MKLFLIIETRMTGIWGFLILFCFCIFSENLHTHTKGKFLFFTVVFEKVRQWKAWEVNEYSHLFSGSWVLSHSGHPQFPKISVSKGYADAGQWTATPAPSLASVQLSAYPLRDTWNSTFPILGKWISISLYSKVISCSAIIFAHIFQNSQNKWPLFRGSVF